MSTYELTITVRGEEVGVKGVAQDIGKIGDAADKAGPRLNAFQQVATGALRQLGAMAATAAVEAAAAIGRFAGDSIKAAGDFEAGLNRMASVAGSSLAEAGFSLDDVKAKALDMGAKTQFSAAQAQDAMINLAKGGVPVVDIMGEATQATLDLAAAGEVDLANAADIVAKQLGVWASTGVTATNVADLLAQAANASTVGVEDLAMGLAQAGGVAKVTGVSFQDTVQTMALLAPGFASAADAGTSYKTFLSRMIPTTDAATKAMMDLGLATGKGNSAFFDAEGHFVGMRQAAELLHGATAGLSEAERMLALNTIFGSDAIRAAAAIAEAGGAGFDAMGVSMLAAGTAAEQAAQRSQGFNFALDSLMGSAETLGIVAGSMLLPALTSLINNALIPGVNAVTEFFGALSQAGSPAATLAGTIGSMVMPAITGLTAALVAYAIVQTIQAIPAIYASIPALAASATAFYANAAAITAALAPYALIALAIGGVVMAYQNFTAKVADATTALLEGKQWWNESSAAIIAYGSASQAVQQHVAANVATIRQLQTEIRADTEAHFAHNAAYEQYGILSGHTRASLDAEMAALVGKKEGLIQVTDAVNTEMAAMVAQQAVSATATHALAAMTTGNQQLVQAIVLTEEEMEKLQASLEKTFQAGAEAVQGYVATEISFLDQANKARAEGDMATLRSQAERYTQEQAAQSAHLGQMLIDYTIAQVQMGNITADKGKVITAAIEQQFGIQRNASAITFMQMASDIDKFAASGSTDINALAATLGTTTEAALATQRQMEDLTGKYETELITNFKAEKINADQLAAGLRDIPERVYTEVITKNITIYETRGDNVAGQGISGYRAGGGPVWPGSAFMVGEAGKELFVPEVPGIIIPNNLVQSLEAGGGAGAGDIGNVLSQFKLTADVVDAGISTFQGIAQAQSNGAQAVGGFANKTVAAMKGTAAMVAGAGVGAATDFAEGAGKIISLISSGVSAFNDLAGMAEVPAGSFKRFADYLTFALYRFGQVVAQFSADAVVQASAFADHAGKIVGLISSGSSAFNDLATMGEVPAGSFKRFADYITFAIYRLSEVAKSFSIEGVVYAAAFAESAGKVLDLLSTGVDGLIKLSTLTTPVPGAFLNFANQVKYLVFRMSEVASGISIQAVASAAAFAEGAGRVLASVGAGVDAFIKLKDFGPVSEEALGHFTNAVNFITRQFTLIASTFDTEAVAAAGLFSESAGKVVGIIGSGVEGFTKLADFKAVGEEAMGHFVNGVRFLVQQFTVIATLFTSEGMAAASLFADGAGKILGVIGAGVDGFVKLYDFREVPETAIAAFQMTLYHVVENIMQVSEAFTTDGMDAASLFAEGAGKILAIVGGAVDGFVKLHDFKEVPETAIAAFQMTMYHVIENIMQTSEAFTTDGMDAAAKFADGAGKILAVVGNGVDGFLKLHDFKNVPETAIAAFQLTLYHVVENIMQVSEAFTAEGMAAATSFAEGAGKIVSLIGTGIDGLIKLADFKGITATALNLFAQSVRMTLDTILHVASLFTIEAINAAIAFAEGVNRTVKIIIDALDTFAKLGDFQGVAGGVLSAFTSGLGSMLNEIQRQVFPATINIGQQMMLGVAQGIMSYQSAVVNAMVNAVWAIINAARGALGIASESKVFHKMMEYAGEGMVGGLNAARGPVAVAAGGLAGVTLGAGIGAGTGSVNNSRSVVVNFAPGSIVAQPGQSVDALADAVADRIVVKMQTVLA